MALRWRTGATSRTAAPPRQRARALRRAFSRRRETIVRMTSINCKLHQRVSECRDAFPEPEPEPEAEDATMEPEPILPAGAILDGTATDSEEAAAATCSDAPAAVTSENSAVTVEAVDAVQERSAAQWQSPRVIGCKRRRDEFESTQAPQLPLRRSPRLNDPRRRSLRIAKKRKMTTGAGMPP